MVMKMVGIRKEVVKEEKVMNNHGLTREQAAYNTMTSKKLKKDFKNRLM